MAFVLVVLGVEIFLVCRLYDRNARKTAFAFDSMDNDDFSFRFPTENVSDSDRIVNESLNRIRQIMSNAKTEIREREKFYEQIINSVNVGIAVIDNAGNVVQKNDEALRLLSVPVFTNILQLRRVGDDVYDKFSTLVPGTKAHVHLPTEIGSSTLSLVTSSALLGGEEVKIVVINDVENELSDNEIDSWIKLIRVLTHEIMNSVTPITSLSRTLLEKSSDEKSLREGLEIIGKTGEDLIAFVENYRKFTHLPTPRPSLFYVSEMAARMKEIALRLDGAGSIKISLDIEPEDLLVYADEKLVSSVMTNLLKNSVQSLSESGVGSEIVIKGYSDEKERVVIEVIDDGPGVPEEIASHIFIPFFTTKKSGSGVGLSLARQIMRLSNGSITLHKDKSARTVFRLTFE